jgi:hypothetical protein
MATLINQGIKISQLPATTTLDTGDLLLLAEKTAKAGVYENKKIDVSYLNNLRTRAANLGTDGDGQMEIYEGSSGGSGTAPLTLRFRRLKQGKDIVLTQNAEDITIDAVVDGENVGTLAGAQSLYAGKNTTNSNLQIRKIVGAGGLMADLTSNTVRIRTKPHHYVFVPAKPTNPSDQPLIKQIRAWGTVTRLNKPGVVIDFPGKRGDIAWDSGPVSVSISSIINALPAGTWDLESSEKGLALVRMRFNVNATANCGHTLSVRENNKVGWVEKISLDPTGGGGAAWEAEDSIVSVVEFDKTTKSFEIKINSGATARDVRYWDVTVQMYLEGLFI